MADFLADPKVYGDLEHDGWTSEGEDYEPKGKEETSSDEDEAPLAITSTWGHACGV